MELLKAGEHLHEAYLACILDYPEDPISSTSIKRLNSSVNKHYSLCLLGERHYVGRLFSSFLEKCKVAHEKQLQKEDLINCFKKNYHAGRVGVGDAGFVEEDSRDVLHRGLALGHRLQQVRDLVANFALRQVDVDRSCSIIRL